MSATGVDVCPVPCALVSQGVMSFFVDAVERYHGT